MENTDKIGILQVLPELETGGVERGVVDLSSIGVKRGYKIIVASKTGKLVKQLQANNVKHYDFNLKSKNPLIILKNAFKLRKIIKSENIKIIHARSRAPAWSAYLASKMTDAKYVTTFHGFYQFKSGIKKFYNSVMAKGEIVISVSNFMKSHIIKNYKTISSRIEVIHRGVDVSDFSLDSVTDEEIDDFKGSLGIDKDHQIILLPGRITGWKGQYVALEAFKNIKREKLCLLICGSWKNKESYYNELLKLSEEIGDSIKVIFSGDISNMKIAYGASDIVLSTSVEPETFGRVSAEANAMGKPVIATAIGGSKEIIKEGETGFLIPPADADALQQNILKLLEILESDSQKESFKQNCRKNIVENFSLEAMANKTFAIYDRLIASY